MQFQAFDPLDQKNEIFGKRSLEKRMKSFFSEGSIFEHVVTGNKEVNDRSPSQR